MKRALFSFALLSLVAVLTGCAGTISSVSFPAAAPWNQMTTGLLSPTDDLVAVSTGAGVESELIAGPAGPAPSAVVACQGSSGPYMVNCGDRACDPQATCGTDTVIEKRFVYSLVTTLDRDVFTTGSVQVQNGSGATLAALAINLAGGGLEVAAGYSEGMVPGAQFDDFDELNAVALKPHWDGFGFGEISSQFCPNGVCSTEVIARCEPDFLGDSLAFVAQAQPGTYSGTCGTIPLTLTINPPFRSVGDCISARKATCNGLRGQARQTCNHAQIGVCHASFNVPSAHNPN